MAVLLVFLALPNLLICTSTSLALLAPRVLFLRVNTSVFYPPSYVFGPLSLECVFELIILVFVFGPLSLECVFELIILVFRVPPQERVSTPDATDQIIQKNSKYHDQSVDNFSYLTMYNQSLFARWCKKNKGYRIDNSGVSWRITFGNLVLHHPKQFSYFPHE
jgi:hypothetical protein